MSFSILSTGRALPKTVLTNEELCSFVDTTDEWIRSRTGIGQRHICMEESLTDLAAEAARRAMVRRSRRRGPRPDPLRHHQQRLHHPFPRLYGSGSDRRLLPRFRC